MSFLLGLKITRNETTLDLFYTKEKKLVRMLITGGIHGDEPSGVLSLFRFLSQNLHDTFNVQLFIIPCVNLWGFNNGRRRCEHNTDLNRSFIGKGPEVLDGYRDWLRGKKFHYYLDCHEDFRFGKNYYFDAFFHHEKLSLNLLKEMKENMPLQPRFVGKPMFSPRLKVSFFGKLLTQILPMGNTLYLLKNNVLAGMVMETGREQPLEERLKAMAVIQNCYIKNVEGVKIRDAEPEDYLFILINSIKERLDISNIKTSDCIIAEFGSRRVGFIRIKRFREFVEIGNMYVVPHYRGYGIFTQLMEKAKEYTKGSNLFAISRKSIRSQLLRFNFKLVSENSEIPQSLLTRFKLSQKLGIIFFNNYELMKMNWK
jgi:GNAT superfamily N-acetyltransferase